LKKLLDGTHRLLTWLMAATVAILIVPVTLQVISRYTALIPRGSGPKSCRGSCSSG